MFIVDVEVFTGASDQRLFKALNNEAFAITSDPITQPKWAKVGFAISFLSAVHTQQQATIGSVILLFEGDISVVVLLTFE